jgi:hypothetical protein
MLISSFAINKLTFSQMQQTKDQGPYANQLLCKEQITFSKMQLTKDQEPDPNVFLCKEQIEFFSDAADQRPGTRC